MMGPKQNNCITLTPEDNQRILKLCGECDTNLRYIEHSMGVEINNRGHNFYVLGKPKCIQKTLRLIEQLYEETRSDAALTHNDIHLAIQELTQHTQTVHKSQDVIQIKTHQRMIHPRSPNQSTYVNNIRKHDINFGVGASGTGKTYLAVACAVEALEAQQVNRIILTRPALEAGERLGFLPGDLSEKVDPYLKPLYDALYEMLPGDQILRLIERNVIEVAPLAYMRGRTLNDAFIILDEGQNTTPEQIKMFLTRIGFSSKAVITGDITQTDLPKSQVSGLRQALEVLTNVEGLAYTFFQPEDVVRHPLVQKIIQAYNQYTSENQED